MGAFIVCAADDTILARTRSRSLSETRSPTVSCSASSRAVRISTRDSRNSVVAPGSSGNQRMWNSHAGAPVARARDVLDLGPHAEQLGDVRIQAGRPGAVGGKRREAVDEAFVDDPLGRADRVTFERDHRGEARATRVRDHRQQRFGRTERLQQVGHLRHRRIGEAGARGGAQRVGAVEHHGRRFEEPAQLVVRTPRCEVGQLVGGARVGGGLQQLFDRFRGLLRARR